MAASHIQAYDSVNKKNSLVNMPASPLSGRSYELKWTGTAWTWVLTPKFERFSFSDFFATASGLNDPFTGSAIGGGNSTGAPSGTTIDALHPGTVVMSSAAPANSGYAWTTSVTARQRCGSGHVFRASFQPLLLTTARSRVGLFDIAVAAGAITHGAFLDITNASLTFVTAAGGVATTSSAVTISTIWYNVEITYTSNTDVTCLVTDDAGATILSVTHSTNVPNTAAQLVSASCTAIKTATTATPVLALDYMGFGR